MSAVYEDPAILDEYLLFHYGKEDDILQPGIVWPDGMKQALDFAKRTPAHFTDKQVSRGLDLGCAVGRSTYEMSRSCGKVIGLDYSHSFIAAANRLKITGEIEYSRRDEGNLKTDLIAGIPPGIDVSRCEFLQGDAMHLPDDLGVFERVHAANLLCRLSKPEMLLERLPGLLQKGGELVLVTPCTWLEAFTPRENWPKTDTLGWLEAWLSDSFELVSKTDEPFLIRETARKFQWTRSMLTVWVRR